MPTLLLAVCGLAAWVAAYAVVVAAVLNLNVPWPGRIVILAAAVWCFWLLKTLHGIQAEVRQAKVWTRLVFITAHIHNESHGLERAMDRYSSDRRSEVAEEWISDKAEIERSVKAWGILIFFVALGAMLHYGVLGPVGQGLFGR